jgi:photosystem II stability/assembly factor-like uncharacterized protein
MKIFGNTNIDGRLVADAASFGTFGLKTGETIPNVFIAGTDTQDFRSVQGNRSVIAQGQYDYIITSQDVGGVNEPSFKQTEDLLQGSVMGYRVQHVDSKTVYTLVVERNKPANVTASFINVSENGGIKFERAYSIGITAFDMEWVNADEAYVVGGKVTPGLDKVFWEKFNKYGLPVITTASNASSKTAVVYKKEANSNNFIPWGTFPASFFNDCATAIAVNKDDNDIVLVGTENGKIYKSADGALTWQLVYNGSNCINKIKFVTGNSAHVWAVGTNQTLLRSTLAGEADTWETLSTSDSSNIVKYYKAANDTRVSIERSKAFNDILLPNVDNAIVIGDDFKYVLQTLNSSQEAAEDIVWKKNPTNIFADYEPITKIKSIIVNTTAYYAAISRDKLFYTSDIKYDRLSSDASNINLAGLDWKEYALTGDGVTGDAIDLVLVTDENPTVNNTQGYAFILTTNGLYEFDFSTNRLSPKRQFPSSFTSSPLGLVAHSYREIYITAENAKILRGTKFQYSFENNFTFVEETSSLSTEILTSINTAKTGRIFAGTNDGILIFKDTGSIIDETTYSTDPVTWTQATSSPTGSAHTIVQLQAIDNDKIYALIKDTGTLDTVLFRSDNSGSSWSQLYAYPENVSQFFVYDDTPSNEEIYALNQDGTLIYATANSFSTVTQYAISSDDNSNFESIEYDSTQTSKIFLLTARNGISMTDLQTVKRAGPFDSQWTLCAITGEDGNDFWIAGGTTFTAKRGTPALNDLGSEPLLLRSSAVPISQGQGGEIWENYTDRIEPDEPLVTGTSGGDFTLTSLSEGTYIVEESKDIFNVYSTANEGASFTKVNSNLYREDNIYPGNMDGIQKLRFYDNKFGVAVSDISIDETLKTATNINTDPNTTSKISITNDGGVTWNYAFLPLEYNFTSVFITTKSLNLNTNQDEYQIFATAYPTDDSSDGVIFKSDTSGLTWQIIYTFPQSTSGLSYRPADIFFVNDSTGSVSVYGNINGTPTVEGIYKTQNGGNSWSFVTISDFAASNTKGHLQFITSRKGYVGGAHGTDKYSGLYKTIDSGDSWTRILTPYSSSDNSPITALHFLDEAVGVIGVGNEIWKTTDSGSSWSRTHQLRRIVGRDFVGVSGSINDIKFNSNGTLGFAVGFYASTNDSTRGEHFVLKSIDSGSSWTEVDSNHSYVDLEFDFDNSRNLVGQPSNLYTIAFAEQVILAEESQSVVEPDPEEPRPTDDCFGSKFMSASYYNFENFAYKCTPSGSRPIYHPNISQNIGLGRGIFGQRTSIDRAVLKNTIRYGAALGVNALGKAENSKGDTAAGFGAMDQMENTTNNVAIGYKALSWNRPDANLTGGTNTTSTAGVNSLIFALRNNAALLVSENGGRYWSVDRTQLAGYGTGSENLEFRKIYKVSNDEVLVLANSISDDPGEKTVIAKYNKKADDYSVIFTSSIDRIDELDVLTPSIVYGIDTRQKKFFKSISGATGFETGSISDTAGNFLRSVNMSSQTVGFIVGSKIWKLQDGSQLEWETSSYAGEHIINAIDYVSPGTRTWVAVGNSGSIYRTTDRGETWSHIQPNITTQNLKDVKSVGNRVIAVGDSGSILVSNNSGLTWASGQFVQDNVEYKTLSNITILDKDSIIVNHDSGLIKTSDGGRNWYDLEIQDLAEYLYGSFTGSEDFPMLIKSITNTRYSVDRAFAPSSDLSIINPSAVRPVPEQIAQTRTVDENVAVGSYSLYATANSSKMVAIGANALRSVSSNEQGSPPNSGETIFSTAYDFVSNITASGLPATYGQIAIGANSQQKSDNSFFNTSVGYASLYELDNSSYNTAIGFYSQHFSNNNRNTSLGVWALGLNADLGLSDGILSTDSTVISSSFFGGSDNIAIGYKALLNNVTSHRVFEMRRAGTDDPYVGLASLGSRNIAIGNNAFLNSNGSVDTIAIGHGAVERRGSDLTDSVFVGNFVGENFGPLTGSYYSSSLENDWRLTQTVAIGSRALQNHLGYDIVAVGANALRGTLSGSTAEEPSINTFITPEFGVLLMGYFNSSILSTVDTSDFSKNEWKIPLYKKKSASDQTEYFIYDELTSPAGADWIYADEVPTPRSVAIASKDVAYGVFALPINKGNFKGSLYPVIMKTSTLSTAGTNRVVWNTVQHVDGLNQRHKLAPRPGVIYDAGALKSGAMVLKAPDKNTLYLLIRQGTTQSGINSGRLNSKSFILKSGVGQYLLGGEGPGSRFETILTGESENSGVVTQSIFRDMAFPTTDDGMVVGNITQWVNSSGFLLTNIPTYARTTDGGSTWESGSIDSTVSGSSVSINGLWMNESASVAYAVGNYGSIYKWTNIGGWEKKLGASSDVNFNGSVNDSFWSNATSMSLNDIPVTVLEYFQQEANKWQTHVAFFDVDFASDSVGYAIGKYPAFIQKAVGGGGPVGYNQFIAKTTDGGDTWEYQALDILPNPCVNKNYGAQRGTAGENKAQPFGEITVIDENTVIIGMSYGTVVYTHDGGTTWSYDDKNAFGTAGRTNGACGCDPYPIFWCSDYKQFAAEITYSSSSILPREITETVTVGSDAQPKQTTVTNNVAVGYKVQFESSGSAIDSVQIGSHATLRANEIEDTVAIGNETLQLTQYSYGTTAVGAETLYTLEADKTNPQYPAPITNQIYAWNADYDYYTSSKSEINTVVGLGAGYSLKMGGSNVFIGHNAGMFNTPKTPTYGDNNIVIGTNAQKTNPNQINQIAIGNYQHNTAVLWGQHNAAQPWIVMSDARDKTDTGSFATGLTFIRELDVKTFKWDGRYNYPSGSDPDGTHKQPSSSFGFIAQDIESAANTAGLDPRAFVVDTTGSSSDGSGSFEQKLIVPGMIDLMVYNAVRELDTTIQNSKYAAFIGDGINTSYTVTHNLNSTDIIASVYDTQNGPNTIVYPTMSVSSSNDLVVTFNSVALPSQYRVIVMK